ncbi:Lrp/AsnC family transcriptional regulator [Vreelandella zhaodongensis]|uniref:Lrp/AsnC family transcriptional regulator n=1 Tax=Vreelandella zhaodongensis TaxID=1176240 RepID=A0ABX2SVR5_VREZH|nr:Lrp/AsnC family transcriptional regulator [Halomonas zhaodongensis]NYS46220.1 Lrp/AsnC family transcriptional regulator [Halomonas zhaodongensis]
MKKTVIDAADIRILCALQQHGPLSKMKLSELVNLSPTPCWVRFNRLRQAGLIRGYHADIALDHIANASKVVVTVSLKAHQKAAFERFERYINQVDEIIECIATGGGMDYVLKVVAPSLDAFQQVIEGLLAPELGVERYMTYITTREVKSTQLNLACLMTDKSR